MLMSPTHYLPSEELRYSNFPELYEVKDKIDAFELALEPLVEAVGYYEDGTEDRIYINIEEAEKTRDLAFELTDFLGAKQKPCFEVIIPIREAQEALNELIFSYRYEKSLIVVDKQNAKMKSLNTIGLDELG